MKNSTVEKVGGTKMFTFLSIEWKRLWGDIKNKVAFLIAIALSLYLVFGVELDFEATRSFDPEPIEATYQDASYFLETKDPEMYVRSFDTFEDLEEQSADLLKALDQKNYREAIVLEKEYQEIMDERYEGRNPKYFLYGGRHYDRGRLESYDQSTYSLYSDYLLESNLALSQEILEGKTVGQSLARSWSGLMPLLFLVLALVFSIDFFASDSKHQSLADAYPLSTYKKSWLRTGVSWSATALTVFIGELVFILSLSFFRDWGGIDLMVTDILNPLSVAAFLVQVHLLFFFALLILLRIASWTGELFRNSLAVILLIPILILPYLLELSRMESFSGFFEWIPLSFIQPGDIVSGFQGFWQDSSAFTFKREIFLLGIIFLFIECLIYITFKMQEKNKGVAK